MMTKNSDAMDDHAMDDHATALVSSVWIVIFDRLSFDESCDQLDLESTFFEQFMLQDMKSTAGRADLFGGESAFQKLATVMTASEQSAVLIRLTANGRGADDNCEREDMDAAMRRCGVPVNSVVDFHCGQTEASQPQTSWSSEVSSVVSANLVWIEASSGLASESANGPRDILRFVEGLLRIRSSQHAKPPVLIVTCRIGDDLQVREPLQCGVSENRMHVPLWIRHGAAHACRVQALAGSFDLLPTVAEFLGHTLPHEGVRPRVTSGMASENASDASDADESPLSSPLQLSADPMSLVRLCGAPQVCTDRLLKLSGDGWKAARTEHFLLVISDPAKTESDGHDSEESSRRLFVKPDDRFNVSDVAGTYVTVADELTGLLEQSTS